MKKKEKNLNLIDWPRIEDNEGAEAVEGVLQVHAARRAVEVQALAVHVLMKKNCHT